MQDFDALQSKSIIQLREIAKSLGIKSSTQMKKDELIQAIVGTRAPEGSQPAAPDAAEPRQTTPHPQRRPRPTGRSHGQE